MAGLSPFSGTVYQIMQLQKLVNMFGGDLLQRYGQKVHKLTLHGGLAARIAMAPSGAVAAPSVTLRRLPMKHSSITLSLNSLLIRPAW
jgi:hypothetical protein